MVLCRKCLGKSQDWHFKGARPQNSPRIRVNQFAFLVANFDFNTTFHLLKEQQVIDSFRIRIKECWAKHGAGRKPLSSSFVNHLIINSVVPYLWLVGDKSNNQELKDKALGILELLPAENNSIIRKWKGIKVQAKTAFDSQGLLALFRYYCCHKKCLSCDIGTKILNR